MSSNPECRKCGDFIYHGSILCDGCSRELYNMFYKYKTMWEEIKKWIVRDTTSHLEYEWAKEDIVKRMNELEAEHEQT